jgi:hypothetical protein
MHESAEPGTLVVRAEAEERPWPARKGLEKVKDLQRTRGYVPGGSKSRRWASALAEICPAVKYCEAL